jgi:hypothetical protein
MDLRRQLKQRKNRCQARCKDHWHSTRIQRKTWRSCASLSLRGRPLALVEHKTRTPRPRPCAKDRHLYAHDRFIPKGAAREQLKPEAKLGNTLAIFATPVLTVESSRLGHFPYFQFPVQNRYPNLNKQVCPLVGPTHLPLFGAPQADNFIDCGFGNTAANRHAALISPPIVDKVLLV